MRLGRCDALNTDLARQAFEAHCPLLKSANPNIAAPIEEASVNQKMVNKFGDVFDQQGRIDQNRFQIVLKKCIDDSKANVRNACPKGILEQICSGLAKNLLPELAGAFKGKCMQNNGVASFVTPSSTLQFQRGNDTLTTDELFDSLRDLSQDARTVAIAEAKLHQLRSAVAVPNDYSLLSDASTVLGPRLFKEETSYWSQNTLARFLNNTRTTSGEFKLNNDRVKVIKSVDQGAFTDPGLKDPKTGLPGTRRKYTIEMELSLSSYYSLSLG